MPKLLEKEIGHSGGASQVRCCAKSCSIYRSIGAKNLRKGKNY